MIITVEKKEGNTYIEIDGHANYEEYGKDILCASVSILYYTLAQRLSELNCKHKRTQREGHIEIEVHSDDAKVNECIDTCLCGLELLANEYSEYIEYNPR